MAIQKKGYFQWLKAFGGGGTWRFRGRKVIGRKEKTDLTLLVNRVGYVPCCIMLYVAMGRDFCMPDMMKMRVGKVDADSQKERGEKRQHNAGRISGDTSEHDGGERGLKCAFRVAVSCPCSDYTGEP